MSLSSIRFNPNQFELTDWSVIRVTGEDRESFFQGQVTNDLAKLNINQGHLTARLNRTGKVQSFFFLAKLEDSLLILSPKVLTTDILSDFEKFIIMDDVVLELLDSELWIRFNSFLVNVSDTGVFDFVFYGINAQFAFKKHLEMPLTDNLELEKLRVLNGWPVWGQDVGTSNFINDSMLNELAISYKKGCFLGQETVAKIENNRGAAYYPMLLKIDSGIDLSSNIKKDFQSTDGLEKRKSGTLLYQVENLLQVLLFRDFRVINRKIDVEIEDKSFSATVMALPYYKNISREDIAKELYHLGVDVFQANNLEEAMAYMKKALAFDPALADAYETLGVMLGRVEKYDEAILWMDQLLKVNPQSVMAHTNKSLFLMKQGKIEEAETEKGLATVKSFAFFGEEAKLKKQILEEQKRKEEDILRREKMFLQVLEIDEEDTIALYGMGDILFQRKEYKLAIANLEKVISLDSNYSTAYLLLGKAYESIGEIKLAISTYQRGIVAASKRGDMMPANEMQSRLNQLVVSSGLL